mmetsp:Transcript_8006/g.12449  ORF Transcript_8006/g.12449 Transcript_8006/m.12449 type:complete len:217 (-) Transcript_8006:61-711(-)
MQVACFNSAIQSTLQDKLPISALNADLVLEDACVAELFAFKWELDGSIEHTRVHLRSLHQHSLALPFAHDWQVSKENRCVVFRQPLSVKHHVEMARTARLRVLGNVSLKLGLIFFALLRFMPARKTDHAESPLTETSPPPVSVRIRDVVVSFLLIPFVDCTLVPFIHLGPVDAKGFVEKPFWVRLVIRPFRLPFHEIRIVCDRGHLSNGTGSGPPS